MGMGLPVGFGAWLSKVWVQYPHLEPMCTLHTILWFNRFMTGFSQVRKLFNFVHKWDLLREEQHPTQISRAWSAGTLSSELSEISIMMILTSDITRSRMVLRADSICVTTLDRAECKWSNTPLWRLRDIQLSCFKKCWEWIYRLIVSKAREKKRCTDRLILQLLLVWRWGPSMQVPSYQHPAVCQNVL